MIVNFVGNLRVQNYFLILISTPKQVGIWGFLKLIKMKHIYIFETLDSSLIFSFTTFSLPKNFLTTEIFHNIIKPVIILILR